ncbi:hypothetical protein HK44_000270 [Pseudomonas fluorescens HK44]|uniref:Uncharacterized protein n=1 Tax=Pseudomonas fluorescens HK44 TaxID=1042209 RepID=A0A010RQB8_PSEFL|nr:hypothetical protein HK44_000270 [Pseudomonas fluorescens HK44]
MTHRIHCSIQASPRSGLTRDQLWEAEDKGLIKCWEIGRERAAKTSTSRRKWKPRS